MDEDDTQRGFTSLIGKTIKQIDASAINFVCVLCTDGTEWIIEAEDRYYGIEIVTLMPKVTHESI